MLQVRLMVQGWNSESSKPVPHCLVLALDVLWSDLIWRLLSLRLKILSRNLIILLATVFYPLCARCVVLSRVSFSMLPKSTELKQEFAYLTSHLERTVLSEKMIEDDLSQVEKSVTKSTYKLGVGFERCVDKGEKSAPKFIPSSNYQEEEKRIKSTKTHYPSNPMPSFNPRKELRKETPKQRVEDFVCMFCGRASHLNEFCFHRKMIHKRYFEYGRNSYHDNFFEFSPYSYSRASPRTSSRVLPRFSHGYNHRSYSIGSRDNRFVPTRFGYGPRPHHGDHFLHRPGFSAGAYHTHLEPRHLDGQRFSSHGSCPTRSNGEVQRTVKTFLVV
jgi:hypothetical protein